MRRAGLESGVGASRGLDDTVYIYSSSSHLPPLSARTAEHAFPVPLVVRHACLAGVRRLRLRSNSRCDEHISIRGDGVLLDDRAASMAAGEAQNLWPFLIYSISVVGLLAVVLTLAWFAGSRTRQRGATGTPFESGVVPVGSAEETRLSIEFYLIAMFFVIFDLETIYIFGWAVAFFELGWRGYLGAALFIGVLLVALIYELRSGALDWGVKHRHRGRDRYSVLPGSSP